MESKDSIPQILKWWVKRFSWSALMGVWMEIGSFWTNYTSMSLAVINSSMITSNTGRSFHVPNWSNIRARDTAKSIPERSWLSTVSDIIVFCYSVSVIFNKIGLLESTIDPGSFCVKIRLIWCRTNGNFSCNILTSIICKSLDCA